MTDKIVEFLSTKPSWLSIKMAWKLFVKGKGFSKIEFIMILMCIDDILDHGRRATESLYWWHPDNEDIFISMMIHGKDDDKIQLKIVDYHHKGCDKEVSFEHSHCYSIVETYTDVISTLRGNDHLLSKRLVNEMDDWLEDVKVVVDCAMMMEYREIMLNFQGDIIPWFEKLLAS